MSRLRLGRIAFINVMPVYYALDNNLIDHPFDIVADIPATLNEMMHQGELMISSCSCLEYARRWPNYYLAKDLSIASNGPVMSVLLLSKRPFSELQGQEILISGQSHTSVILTKLLMQERFKVEPLYRTGNVSQAISQGNEPVAYLTIGDEALNLSKHPHYPYVLDLAVAWREWTGLPFVFAVWVISKKAYAEGGFTEDFSHYLRQSRDYGLNHLDDCIKAVAKKTPLTADELRFYYQKALNFSLKEPELNGLKLFFEKISQLGFIDSCPQINFLDL